jgi:hypothetical protein
MRQPPSKHANFVLIHVASSENEKSLNYLFEKKNMEDSQKSSNSTGSVKERRMPSKCHFCSVISTYFKKTLTFKVCFFILRHFFEDSILTGADIDAQCSCV